jgi:hypothetical protein
LDYRRKIYDDKMKATETLNLLKSMRPFWLINMENYSN